MRVKVWGQTDDEPNRVLDLEAAVPDAKERRAAAAELRRMGRVWIDADTFLTLAKEG